MAGLRPLIVAALFLVIGFLLVILGCTVVPQRNAWPLMSLAIYCFTPIPFFLCGGERPDSFGDSSSATLFDTVGLFLGGMLLVSGPALAAVLFHTGVISAPALWLTLSGGVSFIATGGTLVLASRGEDDEEATNFF